MCFGVFNFLIAYLLLVRTGNFELRRTKHAVPFALGAVAIAIMAARVFGRLHDGLM